jgi:hypothetical protein
VLPSLKDSVHGKTGVRASGVRPGRLCVRIGCVSGFSRCEFECGGWRGGAWERCDWDSMRCRALGSGPMEGNKTHYQPAPDMRAPVWTPTEGRWNLKAPLVWAWYKQD